MDHMTDTGPVNLLDTIIEQPYTTALEHILTRSKWDMRLPDTKFDTLYRLRDACVDMRKRSRVHTLDSNDVEFNVVDDKLLVDGIGDWSEFTNWSFGQMAARLKSPAAFLRTLPTSLTAEILRHKVRAATTHDKVKLLTIQRDNRRPVLQATTGPDYGRIWYADTVEAAIGILQEEDNWRCWKSSMSDRDVDITLLHSEDGDALQEWIDKKNGYHSFLKSDTRFIKGVRIRNSEVGAYTYSVECFFLDSACNNGVILGKRIYKGFNIRHTVNAPNRFASEVVPQLNAFAHANFPIQSIHDKLADIGLPFKGDIDEMAKDSKAFSRPELKSAKYHALSEGKHNWSNFRDLFDGVTAFAREQDFADYQADLQRRAGDLLALVKTAA